MVSSSPALMRRLQDLLCEPLEILAERDCEYERSQRDGGRKKSRRAGSRACWKTTSASVATKCSDAANGSESSVARYGQRGPPAGADQGQHPLPERSASRASRDQFSCLAAPREHCRSNALSSPCTKQPPSGSIAAIAQPPNDERCQPIPSGAQMVDWVRTCLESGSSASVAAFARGIVRCVK